jgi:hypothetical protein
MHGPGFVRMNMPKPAPTLLDSDFALTIHSLLRKMLNSLDCRVSSTACNTAYRPHLHIHACYDGRQNRVAIRASHEAARPVLCSNDCGTLLQSLSYAWYDTPYLPIYCWKEIHKRPHWIPNHSEHAVTRLQLPRLKSYKDA